MPISPENRKKYPGGSPASQLWQDLRAWVRLRSGNRCEGSPAFPDCRAENGKPHPVTGSIVVLTVAHIRHSLDKNGPDDLRHWCQRCHNTHDTPFRAKNRAVRARLATRRRLIELQQEARMPKKEKCPVCDNGLEVGDVCATDIELGCCHAACLDGSPVVDLDTGEPKPGPISTYQYEP